MANKRTIINTSTRTSESITTIDYPSNNAAPPGITKNEYLSAILAGYPGEAVKREPAYSQAPHNVIGSRANGMFLN